MLTKLFRLRSADPPVSAEPASGSELPPEGFKALFARQASTVSVTAFYIGGHLHGFTATSVTPVSMAPPLALFCIANTNTSHRHLRLGSRIGISFLAADQTGISARFAAKVEPGAYADIPVIELSPGVPLVLGAAAGVEAAVTELILAGDHTIFLCQLSQTVMVTERLPLLYHARTYYGLGETVPMHGALPTAECRISTAEICRD